VSLVDEFSLPSPFAGLCLPQECSSSDLESGQLYTYVAALLEQKLLPALATLSQGYPATWNSTLSTSKKAALAIQQSQILSFTSGGMEFFRNLRDTLTVAKNQNQGFTCGSWDFDFWKDTIAIAVLAVTSVMILKMLSDTWSDLKKERSVSGRWRERLNIIPASRKPSISLDSSPGNENGFPGHRSRQPSNGTIPPSPVSEEFDRKHGAANRGPSFSASKNILRLFTVKNRNPGLGTFDALRVISMLWVVLGHTLAIQASVGYINPWALLPPEGLLATWIGQIFFSARYAVDTFFFMSGFLVVYVMLLRFEKKAAEQGVRKTQEGRGFISWLPFFYIHRYLRIVPLYAFLLLVWWRIAVHIGDGPFWFRWIGYTEICDKLWWTNLLFINNLVPWGVSETGGCLYVSWYLADDMQFYLLSPIFFVIYYYRNLTGMTLTLLVCGALVLLSVQETLQGKWSDFTFDGQWVTNFSHYGYTVPWVKAPPYLIGMWTGMFWHRREKKWPDWKFSRCHARIAIFLSLLLIYGILFSGLTAYQNPPCSVDRVPEKGVCGSGWPKWGIVFHTCFSRPLWAFGLSLLSITCFLGQGGIVQSILAHPAWVPFSRLTFATYLIHPIVLNVWFFRQTEKYRWSGFDFMMTYVCVVFVAFMLALLATVVIEQPIASLVKSFEDWLQPLIKKAKSTDKLAEMAEMEFERGGVLLNKKETKDVEVVVRRTEKTSLLDPAMHTNV